MALNIMQESLTVLIRRREVKMVSDGKRITTTETF